MKLLNFFITLLALFSLLYSTVAGYAQSEAQSAYYLIQPGDTLGSISIKFGISEEELSRANNILDPNFISPGDKLLIPNLVGIAGLITPVVLNLGESLDSLTRTYGVDTQTLISLNKITAMTRIVAGSTILVPVKENTLISSDTTNNFSTQFTLFESAVKLDTTIENIASSNDITCKSSAIKVYRSIRINQNLSWEIL
jgi:LysM repeat protein